jgi:hypothetical protein
MMINAMMLFGLLFISSAKIVDLEVKVVTDEVIPQE